MFVIQHLKGYKGVTRENKIGIFQTEPFSTIIDDGVGLGVVGTGAKLPELVQDAEIPVPYQYKIIGNVSKKIV